MKLSWKLFCAMVLIASAVLAVGGYLLIDGQTRAALDRDAALLGEENDLLRYIVTRDLERWATQEEAAERVRSMELPGRKSLIFRLTDDQGQTLASAGAFPELEPFGCRLSAATRGWTVQRSGEGIWLQSACPVALPDGTGYLENCREVSAIFAERDERYRDFFALMLALIAAVGVLSLAAGRVMLRPLGRLSAATRRMASGELDVRVPEGGDDELGELSADFNVMAQRLEEQVGELRRAARRQEDFMGSFAHEIKTPLTSIIGYADLLRSRAASEETVRERAGYIFNEGRRLEAMSRKLMDLIVLDRQDFPLREVDMAAFLAQAAGGLAPALEEQGITLVLRAQPGRAAVEPDLMKTVVLNLLDNARKALERGGRVDLEGRQEGEDYVFRVCDNGPGIPPQDLRRVTEPFYMADKSRARAKGGAGLGLALCQRIVELHGGALDIESLPGVGTAVSVRLKGGSGQ